MKFLICGLGSIGQRHYRNLKSLGHDDIIVYRTGKGNSGFVEKFTEEFSPAVFYDLNRALLEKPDVVFVTNPTSLHVPTAIEVARAGCNLFIEKPVSDKLGKDFDELASLAVKNKLVTYVGYHFRFHPLLQKARRLIKEGKIGKPVSARAVIGERVSDWHPWEDYRASYACRKELGGGVILTQSHALDWLIWFFGLPKKVQGIHGRLGGLGIDVEDVAKIVLKFTNGVVASVDLDYIQWPAKRGLEIMGTEGKMTWDDGTLQLISFANSEAQIFKAPVGFERNTMYIEELKHFIDCVKNKKESFNNIIDASHIVNMASQILV